MRKRRELGPSVYGEKFRIMLEMISHPDGGGWTGTKMERATGGEVITSYYSALRDGHIEVPRADKIEAIAHAMGFPAGLWFKSVGWWEEAREKLFRRDSDSLGDVLAEEKRRVSKGRLAKLLNRLLETTIDEATGEPFTNESVARKSGGVLSEEDVEDIRAGNLADPTWVQVLALCDVLDVEPSYFSGRASASWRPTVAVLEAVEDPESYQIFQNSLRLSGRDRSLLKAMAEHLRWEQEKDERERRG